MTGAAPAIRTEGLGKRYRVGGRTRHLRSLRDVLGDVIANPFGVLHPRRGKYDSWVLRDLTVSISAGEVVGIIGRNGAGKTTLLKLLARITEPSAGWAEIRGRTGALLEVGTGFHLDLTGRENVYLSGAILGLRHAEIRRRFDAIVAFAEVEAYLDTPVKHYSSGMHMRLAFAVAAHLDPEILIVDEVLAVGDAAFQRKCLRRMGEVSSEGRTVLFVSHNMVAIQSLCSRVLWIDQGRLAADGAPRTVVGAYLEQLSVPVLEERWEDPASAPGAASVRLARVAVAAPAAFPPGPLTVRTPLRLEIEFWNTLRGAPLTFCIRLDNREGICAFSSFSPPREYPIARCRVTCVVPGDLLNDGTYRVTISALRDASVTLFRREDALTFEVHDVEREAAWFGAWDGVVRPRLSWVTEPAE